MAPTPSRTPDLLAALAAISATALGAGVGELTAAVVAPSASPFAVIGGGMIDIAPAWAKDLAISWFGTADKAALLVGIAVLLLAVAAVAGVLERRRPPWGRVVLAALGGVGAIVSMTRADAGILSPVPSLVAGAVTAVVGAVLIARLPTPAVTAPVPAAAELGIPGLSPVITPAAEFYRIDTALVVPQVDPSTWSLRIHGLVEQEVVLRWDDLVALPQRETVATLVCVSNDVGGDLIGTARWLGVPIRDVLAMARPTPDADMVLSHSVDGFTASTPIEARTDEREALLAIGMNGEPLPLEHGFPARMVVPGLYGYVSATKWVSELEVTQYARAEGYWTSRGWSARGPVKLASRIDVPRAGARVDAGPTTIAGVAWHTHVGVSGVEVQIDDGPWQPARLATAISSDTWVQWSIPWDATAGPHTVRCRATSADGDTQTPARAAPAPDGATGWHELPVTVA